MICNSEMITLRPLILFGLLLSLDLGVAPGCFSTLMAQEHKLMGVGSCSSSNCHGGTAPRQASPILQNEYVTWFKHDKHAKAWDVLGNEDSRIIYKHLGLDSDHGSPQKDPLCLSCHATYSKAGLYGPKARLEDGVGCESCHGAAEGWLAEHAEKDSTHQKNVEHGLYDIVSAPARAKLCADCHFGTDQNEVTHRLIGAGHPRLTFELDTFGAIEPRHWELDDDYSKRKGTYRPAEFWLVGQLELAIRFIDRLGSPNRDKDGIWPELTLFNCYACHHSLSTNQWKRWDYEGSPGELRLNLSSVSMVREALRIIDPVLAGKLSALITNLHKQYRAGDRNSAIGELQKVLQREATPAIRRFDYNKHDLRRLLIQFGVIGALANYQYEDAEQISMAISAILASLSPDKQLYRSDIERLYKSLANPKEFKAEDFRSAAQKFAQEVSKAK